MTENTKVCGAHFVSQRKSNDPTNIDYVPTVNIPFMTDTPKRETNNSRRVADYDSAVHSTTSMKRKTIKWTGQLFFPIDISDIQSEVEISSESNYETPSLICANDSVSNVIPDHHYHKLWATSDSVCSDSTTQTVDLSTSSFSTQTTDIEISVDDYI